MTPFFYPYFIKAFKKLKSDTFFETQIVNSEIKNQNGELIYSKSKIASPSHWSQTAIDIAASKYFRKNILAENSIFQLVQRIGLGIETSATMSKIFSSKKEIQSFKTEIEYLLLNQTAAFNSPVWFNCGLYEAYKIEIPVMRHGADTYLRYSIQVFNTQKDLDTLYDALKEIIANTELIRVNK